jgi:hypothetical protein
VHGFAYIVKTHKGWYGGTLLPVLFLPKRESVEWPEANLDERAQKNRPTFSAYSDTLQKLVVIAGRITIRDDSSSLDAVIDSFADFLYSF